MELLHRIWLPYKRFDSGLLHIILNPKYPSNGFTSVHLSFRPTEFHFRILLLERSSSGKNLGEEIRNKGVWKSRII